MLHWERWEWSGGGRESGDGRVPMVTVGGNAGEAGEVGGGLWGGVRGEAASGAERPVGVSGWPTGAMRRRGGFLWGPPGTPGAKRDQRLPPEVIGALRSPPQCHDGGLVTTRECDPIGRTMGLTSTGWS